MIKLLHKILISISCCLIFINTAYANGLGRLFISPEERIKLERIRQAKEEPKKVEAVKVEEIIEPVEETKEVIIRDAITLKGLVYRKGGNNAAWINNSNSFEGDFESQYLKVPNEDITSDEVTIIMPDDQTRINLKVGDYYDPQREDDN